MTYALALTSSGLLAFLLGKQEGSYTFANLTIGPMEAHADAPGDDSSGDSSAGDATVGGEDSSGGGSSDSGGGSDDGK